VSDASLAALNTLGVPSTAQDLVTVRSEAALQDLLRGTGRLRGTSLTVLGGGSNVVLRRHVPGVVCLIRLRGQRLDPGPAGCVELTVAAGETWHDVVRFSLGQGLAGLENLALIPGSAGAAPIQNIGAYGVELADRFVRLNALDASSGAARVFDLDGCRFGYRDSMFKTAAGRRWIITSVTLRLQRRGTLVLDYPDLLQELERMGNPTPTAVRVAEAVIRVRRRKLPDPRQIGNVGSFFKNPEVPAPAAAALQLKHPWLTLRSGSAGGVKLSAAQLIDACGWKGQRLGPVGVWHRQPLVLVNLGGATGADVIALSDAIRRDVAARFGVTLVPEPELIGQDDSPVFGRTP
jgi:UDP-N-acetylmuramate dehydrogenase